MYGKGKCLYSRVKDQILAFTRTFLILSDALKHLKKHVVSDNQRKQPAAALMVPLKPAVHIEVFFPKEGASRYCLDWDHLNRIRFPGYRFSSAPFFRIQNLGSNSSFSVERDKCGLSSSLRLFFFFMLRIYYICLTLILGA